MTTVLTGPGLGARTTRAPAGSDRGAQRWDLVVASAALPLVGLAQPLAAGATTATAVVVALAPVWFPAVARSRSIGAVLALAALAVPAGLLLSSLVGPPAGRGHDASAALAVALLLLTGAGSVGVVLWARTLMSLPRVALLVGTGLLADGVLESVGSPNPWKYALSFPVTLVVLALLWRRPTAVTALALTALAVVGVLNESRSYAGFCVLAVALVVWRSQETGRSGRFRVLGVIAAAAFAAYNLGVELLVQGYLGEVLQQRSVEQVQNAGSLLAGGRPEWAATRALFTEHPWGFGLGAVPTSSDLRTAKTGLDTVGISGDNGYVNNYMFGDGFKLHAVVADLWASFGAVGVALGVLLVVLVLRALATTLAGHRPAPLVVFLSLMTLWWLLFGPMQSNFLECMLALALGTPLRAAREP